MKTARAHVDRRRESPFADQNLGGLLRDAAAERPDWPALVELRGADGSQRRWTFSQLLEEAERVAQGLLDVCAPGERIGIWSENRPEWLLLMFGAALAGIVVVAVNPAYRKEDLLHVLVQGRVVAVFYGRRYRETDCAALLDGLRDQCPDLRMAKCLDEWDDVAAVPPSPMPLPEVAPESALIIQYTSGTTGEAKGAILSHKAILNNLRVCERDLAMKQGSAWIASMPLYTISGSVVLTVIALWNRGRQIIIPRFEPRLFFRAVEEEGGSCAPLVPTMLVMLLDHPGCADVSFDNLELLFLGGAPVAPALAERGERVLGADIMIIWGQTEAAGMVSHTSRTDPLELRVSSIGYVLPGREVRIAGPENGETLELGQAGEICVRGLVMDGYLDLPGATAAALDPEGWLHTGDIGEMHAGGLLKITGRLKDMIIRGGMNIYPKEIEDQIMLHPDVAEVAVFGIADPKWGEIVATAIRPREGSETPSIEALQAFLADRIAHFKIPHRVISVDIMPLAESGKVRKDALARLAVELAAAERGSPASQSRADPANDAGSPAGAC